MLVMVVVIPVVLISGLMVRRPITTLDSLPGPAAPAPPGRPGLRVPVELAGHALSLRVYTGSDEEPVAITLIPRSEGKNRAPSLAPDVLLYWSPVYPSDDEWLGSARFIGPFDATEAATFMLTGGAFRGPGFLVAYSLAHREWLDAAPVSAGREGN